MAKTKARAGGTPNTGNFPELTQFLNKYLQAGGKTTDPAYTNAVKIMTGQVKPVKNPGKGVNPSTPTPSLAPNPGATSPAPDPASTTPSGKPDYSKTSRADWKRTGPGMYKYIGKDPSISTTPFHSARQPGDRNIPAGTVAPATTGGGPGTPTPPDLNTPEGVLQAQQQANQQNLAQQSQYNRINENSPLGGASYTQNPDGTFTRNINLSPAEQTKLQQEQGIETQANTGAQSSLTKAIQNFSKPLDYSGLPEVPQDSQGFQDKIINQLYSQYASRLDPQFAREETALRQHLAQSGIPEGSALWNNQMRSFQQNKTDAYGQATNQAITTGQGYSNNIFGQSLQGRQQGISEIGTQRAQPFQEATGLLGIGPGVQFPQVSPTYNVNVPGLDVAGPAGTFATLGERLKETGMNNATQIQSAQIGAASAQKQAAIQAAAQRFAAQQAADANRFGSTTSANASTANNANSNATQLQIHPPAQSGSGTAIFGPIVSGIASGIGQGLSSFGSGLFNLGS